MTAPNAHEPSARDQGEHEHPSDVWMPTMLRPAPEPAEGATVPAAEPTVVATDGGVSWHRVPEPPEPPWRATNRSRMVALVGGRSGAGDSQVTAELERLREEAAAADERLTRQRTLLDQLDHQLAEARHHATAEGIGARQAERRVAELDHELALAHEELERLRARDLVRTDRVVAQIEDHHRSLVAALRADDGLIEPSGNRDADASAAASASVDDAAADADAASSASVDDAAADPTLLALRHWLSPEGAMLIVDGDALGEALVRVSRTDAVVADDDIAARRSLAVGALRIGLNRHAARSAIVFDGSLSSAAPAEVLADPLHEPRVLVTAPGVEVTSAVGALIGRHHEGSVVLAHEAVAAAGVVTAQYRLAVDALAAALTPHS
jgi:hypothetical protein